MTGLWRTQIIVACMACYKSMGWHVLTTTGVCNACKACKAEAIYGEEYGNICIDHTRTDTSTDTRTDKGHTT